MNPATSSGGSGYEMIVPALLLVIMVCMGMELVVDDFRQIRDRPRAPFVGLLGQILLLPLVGLAFSSWPGFAPEIAIGIVIITACPGGTTSNIFSYLAGANLALSITLTALSSMACFLTVPLWIYVALAWYGPDVGVAEASIRLPIGRTMGQLFVVMLLPIVIGMTIRARWPEWSNRVREPMRRGTTGLMGAAVILILGNEWSNVLEHLQSASQAALILVSVTLAIGYGVARLSGLDDRDAFTISIEVGLQNGALATMIVVTLLQRTDLIVFPGTYVVLSLAPVLAWTLLMRRRFP